MPVAPVLVVRESKPTTTLVPARDVYGNLIYIDPNNPPVLNSDDDLWWGSGTLGGKYVGHGFTVGGIIGLVVLCLFTIFVIISIYVCFFHRRGRRGGARPPKGQFKPVPGGSSGTRGVGDLEDEDYMNLPGPSSEKPKVKKSGTFSNFAIPKIFKRGGDKGGKEGERLVGDGGNAGQGGAAKEHYRKLNLPGMVGSRSYDEGLIGNTSPPVTPAATFGWNNTSAVAAGREAGRGGTVDTGYLGARGGPPSESGSEYGPPKYTPPPTTASSTTSGENGNGRRDSSRISGNWDEMYQSKPSPNLFDDEDKELYSRRGY